MKFGKEEIKLSPVTNNIIAYIENLRESTKKKKKKIPGNLQNYKDISKFSKVAWYKVMQKGVFCLFFY